MKKLGVLVAFIIALIVFAMSANAKTYEDLEYSEGSITNYYGDDQSLSIPSEINGEKITSISSLGYNDSLKYVFIPDTINLINQDAFDGCCNLEKFYVDNNNEDFSTDESGVLFCGSGLFRFPIGSLIEDYKITKNIGYILDRAFYNCQNLKSVYMADPIEYIGEEAFKDCRNLNFIYMQAWAGPYSNAFEGCDNLKEIICSVNTGGFIEEDAGGIYWLNNLESLKIYNRDFWFDIDEKNASYILKNTTIYGYKESTAENFALKYDIKFVAFEDICGHSYERKLIKEPTCTESGESSKICVLCGAEDFSWDSKQKIEPLGHKYSDLWVIDEEPTCLNIGKKSHHCIRCDGKVDETEISVLAHSFGEWHIIRVASCSIEGIENRECTCGETEERRIEKISHAYTAVTTLSTCTEEGFTTYTCECGDSYVDNYVDATGHIDEDGDYICDNGCGYEFEKIEPETPDEPEEKPCDCNCHKGGITAFFFKLINFFAKLFDKSAGVCKCGAKH